MNFWKKLTACALAAVMSAGFAGCGNSGGDSSEKEESDEEAAMPYDSDFTIGVDKALKLFPIHLKRKFLINPLKEFLVRADPIAKNYQSGDYPGTDLCCGRRRIHNRSCAGFLSGPH